MKIIVRANSNTPTTTTSTTTTTTSTTTTTTPLTTTTTTPLTKYYLNLGDSYAAGITGDGSNNTGGYATKVVTDLASNHPLTLFNFGCSGASTVSMMSVIGCTSNTGDGQAPGGVEYPTTTQLAAVLSFINSHPGQIGLITISIGGNDLLQGATTATMAANLVSIVAQLRASVGASVPIIGLTYPDTDLVDWLSGPSGETSAEASITEFQQVVNPAFAAAYAKSNVTFVDVTAAAGAYTPLTQLVNDSTYGEIPYAVAQVCILTGICSSGNIHPTDAGYTLIAQQIVLAYLKLIS
jgi:lysophospholipase L1-like esterase